MSQREMLEAAYRKYAREEVEEAPLNILDPGNELLQDLVDRFSRIWSTGQKDQRGRIACFYELQASDVGAIVGQDRRRVLIRILFQRRSGLTDNSNLLSMSDLGVWTSRVVSRNIP